jgi:CelD/BcsL family acetyltransferase involved in cellulose biosynthesis
VSAIRTRLVPPACLSDELLDVWRAHQASDERLAGPFFSPEYVRIAAAAGADVSVAVIEPAGELPAFLPLQRDRSNVARPVGLRACDFSGLIAAHGLRWSAESVIRHCGLAGWDFANVDTSHDALQPHFRAFADSPFIDLSAGFEGFAEERVHSRSDLLRSVAQKIRKMEREIGPLRIEVDSSDPQAFDLLLAWKSAQRERTGTFDVLGLPWMRDILSRVRTAGTPDFSGLLSVAYAGQQVAAVHLGMRTRTIWHYWFAAFNRDLHRYSPGLILLLEMARAAPGLGVRRLTLGRGDEAYKLRFASGHTLLASGSVDCRVVRRVANAAWYAARRVSLRSPAVAALARSLRHSGRRILDWADRERSR